MKAYDSLILALLRRGVEAGEFVDIEPSSAKRAIDAVVNETIRAAALGDAVAPNEPDLVASFVLRALLTKPARLTSVRATAAKLDS